MSVPYEGKTEKFEKEKEMSQKLILEIGTEKFILRTYD